MEQPLDKLVSNREAILRERAACQYGAELAEKLIGQRLSQRELMEFDLKTNEHYPLPVVTRTRVVTLGPNSYRCVDGVLQVKYHNMSNHMWERAIRVRVDHMEKLIYLMANPTEVVEDV